MSRNIHSAVLARPDSVAGAITECGDSLDATEAQIRTSSGYIECHEYKVAMRPAARPSPPSDLASFVESMELRTRDVLSIWRVRSRTHTLTLVYYNSATGEEDSGGRRLARPRVPAHRRSARLHISHEQANIWRRLESNQGGTRVHVRFDVTECRDRR